jgi:ribonuclease R
LLTDSQIISHIQRQPRQTAGYKQLLREMHVRGHERRTLEERLRQMVKRGQLVEVGRDKFAMPQAASGGIKGAGKGENKNLVSGKLHMHRDGYGFVTPDSPAIKERIEGDIYIPPPAIGMAMHGDHVMVELGSTKRDGRAEGRIVQLVGRAHSTVVGTFHYGDRHNYVTPIDDRISQEIIIPQGAEVPEINPEPRGRESRHRVIGSEAKRHYKEGDDLEGVVVDVELTQWPSPAQPAKGRVLEVLGYEDDFGVDVEIIIRKHHLPHYFPDEVLEQAQHMSAVIPQAEVKARHDYRGLPIVTIDGETARDFDDAVYAKVLPNGNYELQVHIADVAQYVNEDTPLDEEARLRGTSVYFPDRAVPMLPLELSTDICSLRPNVDRLVLSCIMEIDRAGEVQGYAIHEGIICSAARMTYTNVQLILDGDAGMRREYAHLVDHFELMRELAETLNRKRVRRGSIDFDLPEPAIEFDEQGLMQGISRTERKFAHRLIEEFMLAANECVAAYFETNRLASLYRIHEKPSPKRIYEFELLAASFGYSLGVGNIPIKSVQTRGDRRHFQGSGRQPQKVDLPEDIHVTPRMYQKLTQKIAGKPEERVLSFLMLRSLKQARYSEKNEGHFALAAPVYTHFTSPIRRYPDLIVHRILKEVIRDIEAETDEERVSLSGGAEGSEAQSPWSKRQYEQDRHAGRRRSRHQQQIAEQHAAELGGPIPEHLLHDMAEESSFSERRADEAERELIEWKKIKFMADRIGEEFDALIISTTKFGFFVELTDMFIEGLVPLQTLIDDRYTYRENTRQIIGERTKRAFSIGDRVKVVLDRIDRMQRKLQFSLVVERASPARAMSSDQRKVKQEKQARRKERKAKERGKKRR